MFPLFDYICLLKTKFTVSHRYFDLMLMHFMAHILLSVLFRPRF